MIMQLCQRRKILCTSETEIFKTININQNFMKDIFAPKKHHKSAKYDDKSLIALSSKIWNQLPSNVKSLTFITKFKEYIRT